MKASEWWFIITGFFKHGLPVSEIILRSILNFNLNFVEVALYWRHRESWRWKWKQKKFWDRKMNPREITMKYGRLAVFIRHDSAEIWGFRYVFTVGIGTSKLMACNGVFRACSSCSEAPFKLLSLNIKHDFDRNKAYTKPRPPKDGAWERKREREVHEGRQRKKFKKRQPMIVVDWIKLNT